MKYARHWGAIANHSGDAYFNLVYQHDWPNTLNELAKYREPKRTPGSYDALREARRQGLAEGDDDGRVHRFLDAVWSRRSSPTAEGHAIMNVCMAATYDADPRWRSDSACRTTSRPASASTSVGGAGDDTTPFTSSPEVRPKTCHAHRDLRRLRLA